MTSTRQFRLFIALVSLVVFSLMLAACSADSYNGLAAAANATQGSSDDPTATVIPTVTMLPPASPTVTPTPESTAQGREIEFKGVIQAIEGNTITINGQTFTVPPEILAKLATQLKVGSTIELKGHLTGSGITIIKVTLEGEDSDETTTPTPTSTLTPTVKDDDGDKDKNGTDNDDTKTPAVKPTKTPKGDDGNNDDKPSTRQGGPTNPVALTAIAKNPVAATAVFRQDRGKGDDKTKAPAPTPTVKAPTTPGPVEQTGADNSGKGNGNGNGNGKGKGGK